MRTRSRSLFLWFLVLPLIACGTFQVGVERQPTPDLAVTGTIAALETENARLTLQQAVTPAVPRPQPTSGLTAVPTRITFQRGSASYSLSADLIPGLPQRYILQVLRGQRLIIAADQDLQVLVYGPDDQLLAPVAVKPREWDYTVTQTGDETIVLTGSGHTTITIYVPPL